MRLTALVDNSNARSGCCRRLAAVAESFFKTLKAELIYHCPYQTRDEARLEIFDYIEVYYNRQRKHSTNGYLSPVNYEKKWLKAA
jgi:transposase InsO family protein